VTGELQRSREEYEGGEGIHKEQQDVRKLIIFLKTREMRKIRRMQNNKN
jgi:hypothetical protein